MKKNNNKFNFSQDFKQSRRHKKSTGGIDTEWTAPASFIWTHCVVQATKLLKKWWQTDLYTEETLTLRLVFLWVIFAFINSSVERGKDKIWSRPIPGPYRLTAPMIRLLQFKSSHNNCKIWIHTEPRYDTPSLSDSILSGAGTVIVTTAPCRFSSPADDPRADRTIRCQTGLV